MNVIIASSSTDGGIGCWDLQTEAEQLRYKTCASPPHGLSSIGSHFLACSQLRYPSATSGHILYWSWSKVWSLSRGRLLRNIVFPSIIDAIALDPGEHVFYAGSRDGKIYISALNAASSLSNSYGLHITSSLSDNCKPVTRLVNSAEGNLLLFGSEDGMVQVWDVKTQCIIRMFRHAKGPVNNILIVRSPLLPRMAESKEQASSRSNELSLPSLLEKYANSTDEDMGNKAIISLPDSRDLPSYLSSQLINDQIKELQVFLTACCMLMDVYLLWIQFTR